MRETGEIRLDEFDFGAICASWGLDLRLLLEPSRATATGAARERIRRAVPFVERDLLLASHFKVAEEMVRFGALVEAAEGFVELR